MAISESSAKVFEYMKGFVGKQVLTVDSIAEATGLTPKSVNGTLLALSRKNIFTRVAAVNEEGAVVKYIVPTDEINSYNPYEPSPSDLKKSAGGGNYSDTSKTLIKILQGKVNSNENFTAKDLSLQTGLPLASVNGSLTGFAKKGYIERMEPKATIIDGVAVNVRYIKVLPTISEIKL